MRQVSLVTLYGQKPANLQGLIIDCQERISSIPGIRFQPYDPRQVHGTLISLERTFGKANLNFALYRNSMKPMDFDGLLLFLRTAVKIPFQIQIGGFENRDYPFVSQGKKPYERSFSIQDDKAVLMGWPVRIATLPSISSNFESKESLVYPNTLDDLRRAAQDFNILHTYHRDMLDVDNDFYFRIGLVEPSSLDAQMRKNMEDTLRVYLEAIPPVIVEIAIKDIHIVSYVDNRLPYESTQAWPISDSSVTGEFICGLYD